MAGYGAAPGSGIRLAFNLNTTASGSNNAGWYLDNIETILINPDSANKSPITPGHVMEDLPFNDASNQAEWYTDNGVWELGSPSLESGFDPSANGKIADTVFNGLARCSMDWHGVQWTGTVFNGTYPNGTGSRLISPPLEITSATFRIELDHNFLLSEGDSAFIELSTGNGKWIKIGDAFTGTSGTKTTRVINDVVTKADNPTPISVLGRTVRLGFLLTSGRAGTTNNGWYIASIRVGTPQGPIPINTEELELPTSTVLHQNYPNLFDPTTTLSFELDKTAPVTLTIYDLPGRKIETLVDGALTSGPHAYTWGAQDVSSGIYLYRLTTPSQTVTRQMILFR